MVSTVSLGNIVTVNGKTMAVGSASGLDVKSIVDSLVAVKQTDETKITDKITADNSKLSAISQYRTLLANLQTSTNFLKNPSGVSNDANNIFQYRKISATTSDGTDPTNYITASSSAGATIGGYDIQVNNLASAENATSISFSSETASLATSTGAGGTPKAGVFSFNGQTVTISVGDSLDNIAAAINGTTANSGVHADIIKVSDTDFRLKISATKTGVDNGYAVRGDTTVFNSMFTGTGSVSNAANDASFTLDGSLTITRPTNSISDVINGITFTLQQPTPVGTTVTLNVAADTTSVEGKITDFVNAYNAAKTFISQQQQRDSTGAFLKTAVLGEDSNLNNFITSAAGALSSAVNGLTGTIQSLADIGITFVDQPASTAVDSDGNPTTPAVANMLQVDSGTLETQLDGSFDQVRSLFEFQLNSDAPDRVSSFSDSNQMSVNSFTMNADFSQASGSQVKFTYVDANGVTQTVNATTNFGTQNTATSKAASSGIFGATDTTTAFTGITSGDSFEITLNKADGTTTNSTFVYKTSPSAANEFNDLSNLSTAISSVMGSTVTAAIDANGELQITPTAQFDTLSFTNLGATDFKTNLGLSNTKMPAGTVSGPAGSALEGLSLIYAPKTPQDTVNVTFTQGVGDQISNVLGDYLTASTGLLDQEVANINTDLTTQQQKSTDEQTKINNYQTQLYNQYSALDAAVSKINSLLTLLDAQDKERQKAGS